jgi:1,4-alpha-glucan branching enzyme
MLFMGEEFGAETPFLFFCDFKGDLAAAVTAGRRDEFARFSRFNDPADRERIPDPNAATTFESSRLNWNVITQPRHSEWLGLYRQLLKLRRDRILPLLSTACRIKADYEVRGDRGLTARWKFSDTQIILVANLGSQSLSVLDLPDKPIIYASKHVSVDALQQGILPAWSVVWFQES